ncbi:50S ribosomal protein L25 [Buchnera aphidicola]|uniref:50S ribosomal protein L25 n=1 Tax=Buchnera aphidicola (Cinara strobi) TaxID=1921549 RepID=A0A3B1DKV8_9GAMM|nr:50S ribosomal protein L25 [Buchnera aphidicola]VAX76351.1 50S ribosomal protein L25 [Buchnera aphidicola (Cinara strobi)]
MIILNAILRIKRGTNNSRYVRKVQRKVPGIIYGKKFLKNELLILLDHDKIFNLQEKDILFSKKMSIFLENKKFLVIVKDIQYHAFKPILLHIDFLCIG